MPNYLCAGPKHLASKYGKQWEDRSMATAYCHRLPYPESLFDVLQGLAERGQALEIGAGTGHATVQLARRFPRVHAIEPSAQMLAAAMQHALPNVTWTQSTFEEAILFPPYVLAVAAESLSRHTRGETVLQPLDDYIESFHSRNGLSRERMSPTDCEAFDSEVRRIVTPHLVSTRVAVTTYSTLSWGVPMPGG
jgi:hypothetical protein